MRVWVRYVRGRYVDGWAVSSTTFDELIYMNAKTADEAVEMFKEQFKVEVSEVIKG